MISISQMIKINNIEKYHSQRQNYMITAEEVAESMGISLGYAYKLLRKLNKELADQGYVTVAGKIPRAFWEKKFYGYSQIAM